MFFSPQRSQRDTEDLAPWISVFSVVSVFFTTEVTAGHRGLRSVDLRALRGIFFTTEVTAGHRGLRSVDLRVLRGECFFHHRGHRETQRI